MKITNFLASFARVVFALAITLISSSSLISCSDSPNPEPDPDHSGGTINELNIDGSPFRISSAQYNSDKYGKGKYELRLGDFNIKKIVPQSTNPQASAQQEIVLEINATDNGKQIAMDNSNNKLRFMAPGLECNSGGKLADKFIGKTSIESKKDIAIAARNDNALTIIGEKNASLELEALNTKFAIIASKDITLKGDETNIKSESAVRSEKGKISIATKCSFETSRTDGAIQAYNGIEFDKSSYLIIKVEDYKIVKNNENYQTIMDKDGNPLKEVVFS